MPEYLVHSSKERARFRHPALCNAENKKAAVNILKKEKGVAGIKPGHSSVLAILDPEADLENLCKKLETGIPALGVKSEENKTANSSVHIKQKNQTPFLARKTLLQTFLTSGLVTVGLALTGMHKAHALAGGIFSLLAINHVWTRRKAL